MQQTSSLDLSDAEKLVGAARAASVAAGVDQNIAIVDRSGELLAFVRMDGAKWISGQMAINKAFTAAGTRMPTADLAARTEPTQPGWMIQTQHDGRFTTLGGGLPIIVEGEAVGAIGVSGGSVAQDIEIAEAALAAFLQS